MRYVRRLLRLRVRLCTRNSLSVCPRCARLAVSERFVSLCSSRPRFYGLLSPSAIRSCGAGASEAQAPPPRQGAEAVRRSVRALRAPSLAVARAALYAQFSFRLPPVRAACGFRALCVPLFFSAALLWPALAFGDSIVPFNCAVLHGGPLARRRALFIFF